jgi:serine/threonine-protein kinase
VLPGTEGARQPFFSPDGRWLAFFHQGDGPTGELKKVSLAGGRPQTLVENINGARWTFGTWLEDDTILFGFTDGLKRVSAAGGSDEPVTTVNTAEGERGHFSPAAVEGTGSVLFTVGYLQRNDPRIEAVQLDSGERRVILENAIAPRYLASGHLVFVRDDVLLVAPFDAETMSVTGPMVSVMDDVRLDRISPEMAVSRNGTMIYVPAVDTQRRVLDIVSRSGEAEPLGPLPGDIYLPRVSPNGQYVAYRVDPGGGADKELHLYEVARGATSRMPLDGTVEGFAWRPNNQELAVTLTGSGSSGIFLVGLSGTARRLVSTPASSWVRSGNWSPDGREYAYTVQTGLPHAIWVVTMDPEPSTRVLLDSPAAEYSPAFSPDGRWLAYISNESGQGEIYIQRYPGGERLRVSVEGGGNPVWNPDGRELFFTGSNEEEPYMMSVSVTETAETLNLGPPTPVFPLRVTGPTGIVEQYVRGNNTGAGYDIFPDGQRFVMVRDPDPRDAREIIVVQNWFTELKKLAPISK